MNRSSSCFEKESKSKDIVIRMKNFRIYIIVIEALAVLNLVLKCFKNETISIDPRTFQISYKVSNQAEIDIPEGFLLLIEIWLRCT